MLNHVLELCQNCFGFAICFTNSKQNKNHGFTDLVTMLSRALIAPDTCIWFKFTEVFS